MTTGAPDQILTAPNKPFRILSLDGGGAKGFYTLGILKEIEALVGSPLSERFDLIFGTSTGGIIAALLALGYRVDEIHELYSRYVPEIMRCHFASSKTTALKNLAQSVFKEMDFNSFKHHFNSLINLINQYI